MKRLHRPDLYAWSSFDEERNVDFNGLYWASPLGGVVVDPMPLCAHDHRHIEELGGVSWVVVTNSDHTRQAEAVVQRYGASLAGPAAERDGFPLACDRWLDEGDELFGLRVLALHGSKTPGELALLLDRTLITGDLVRAHVGGSLMRLPDPKLSNKALALASIERLAALDVEAVIVGDGWPIFRDGQARLRDILVE